MDRNFKMPAPNTKLQWEMKEKKGDDCPSPPPRPLEPPAWALYGPRLGTGVSLPDSRGLDFEPLFIPSVSAFECMTLTPSHLL